MSTASISRSWKIKIRLNSHIVAGIGKIYMKLKLTQYSLTTRLRVQSKYNFIISCLLYIYVVYTYIWSTHEFTSWINQALDVSKCCIYICESPEDGWSSTRKMTHNSRCNEGKFINQALHLNIVEHIKKVAHSPESP